MNWIVEHWDSLLAALGIPGGGLVGFLAGRRKQKLNEDTIQITNLSEIIKQVQSQNAWLQQEMKDQRVYFEGKCEIMQDELNNTRAQLNSTKEEVATLKKKLSEQSI